MSTEVIKRTRKRRIAIVSSDSESEVESAPAKRKMGGLLAKSKETKPKPKATVKRTEPAQPNGFGQSSQQNDANVNAPAHSAYGGRSDIVSISNVSNASQDNRVLWTDEELLSQLRHIDRHTSANIVRLFDEGNTIPFICRYRREMINHMDADEMREIKNTYNHIQNIRSRASTVIKDLEKKNELNAVIKHEILSAKSIDAIDHLHAPFKTASKASLAERAKALGLGDAAESVLNKPGSVPMFQQFVSPKVDGLQHIDKVKDGMKNIISHTFSKDTDVLEAIQTIVDRKRNDISIESTENAKETKLYHEKTDRKAHDRTENPQKFEIYFSFTAFVSHIQPHQVLAINRGESLKYLTVKIVISERVQNEIQRILDKKYRLNDARSSERADFLTATFKETYSKKLKPLITREVRSHLKKLADKVSVEVFAKNLKQLLLMHPVKGNKILGIDPGFRNGCKMALISEQNDVLATETIYPHTHASQLAKYEQQLVGLLKTHRCELIAIGNGTASRETEIWVANMIGRGQFHSKSVRYCVVNENGASIYSCSDVAKREFPDMDINLISAVSIARRLSDPLAELVKIEPKHMGVGMYQHDINEKYLMETLDEVVMECVSFVGVDINTASNSILKYIAGLNAARAENIIKHRMENGPFKTRDDIKKVKSIGPKSFEQCAGFIRIDPVTSKAGSKFNVLDSTWVHPESYATAKKLMQKWRLSMEDIGTEPFIRVIKGYQTQESMERWAKECGVSTEQIMSILEALSRELRRDYRDDKNIRPVIKQELLKMGDLQKGQIIQGTARNVTTFGCFVDIGVEQDGLIHSTKMGGHTLSIGDRVDVRVMNVDTARRRVELKLENVL